MVKPQTQRLDTEFVEKVREYVALDDQLKQTNLATRPLNARRKELREWIPLGMRERDISKVRISGTTQFLCLREVNPKPKRTQELITARIQRFLDECMEKNIQPTAKELYDSVLGKEASAINESEELQESTMVLSRRTENKKKKKKKKKNEQGGTRKKKVIIDMPVGSVCRDDDFGDDDDGQGDQEDEEEEEEEERAMGMDS